ncbi:hypothetical protein Dda_9032 [Drechslerella dactyloides]|uniref:Radical SAM core domain-containing protein n=1 Tax=Drechslerella dactyloides TaxID=74499 RepID=A0AAD6ITL9_DREDA|nr:hypothetical protein Dda_9032 [Drechslerella dactyloides]
MHTILLVAALAGAYFILIPWSWVCRKYNNISFVVQAKMIFRRNMNKPISVNYHFTRRCNYICGFCFHTAKTSHILSLDQAKRGLKLLKEAGMRKLNFAGGEPFLEREFLGKLMQYCKEELNLESVSVVTNGSLVTEQFFKTYGKYLDIMAVSCDSFDDETNALIGRGTGRHLHFVRRAAKFCAKYRVKFKINTVVNRFNWQEDMNDYIQELKPFRWKCFQVLQLKEENDGGENAIRDVSIFLITDDEFEDFCNRHKHNDCLVPEGNNVMVNSYLILDEYMCFLDKDAKVQSKPILEVGVHEALKEVRWDTQQFIARDAIYEWQRETKGGGVCDGGEQSKNWD